MAFFTGVITGRVRSSGKKQLRTIFTGFVPTGHLYCHPTNSVRVLLRTWCTNLYQEESPTGPSWTGNWLPMDHGRACCIFMPALWLHVKTDTQWLVSSYNKCWLEASNAQSGSDKKQQSKQDSTREHCAPPTRPTVASIFSDLVIFYFDFGHITSTQSY